MSSPLPNVFGRVLDTRQVNDLNVANTQAAHNNLRSTVYSPFGTPLWQSPFDGDDVSVPWVNVTKKTTPSLGIAYWGSILIGRDRTIDVIRLGAATSSATSVYVGLYKFNRATGIMTKIFDSGECKTNYNTNWRTGGIVSVPLGSTVDVIQGEAYAVAVLQVGGTAGDLLSPADFVATPFAEAIVPSAYPDRLTFDRTSSGGLTALPSTINTVTNIFSEGRPSIWTALGTAVEPLIPTAYDDPFYRPDSSTLGSLWQHKYRSGGTEQLNIKTGAAAPPVGVTYDYVSTYVGKMREADHMVAISGSSSTVNPARLYLPIRSSDTNQVFLKWDVANGQAWIMTATGSSWNLATGGTDRSGVALAPNAFGRALFQAVGNVYTAQCIAPNGSYTQFSWNDSGVLHPNNETQRVVGLGVAGFGIFTSLGIVDAWLARGI